jgi:hypothetical protein
MEALTEAAAKLRGLLGVALASCQQVIELLKLPVFASGCWRSSIWIDIRMPFGRNARRSQTSTSQCEDRIVPFTNCPWRDGLIAAA